MGDIRLVDLDLFKRYSLAIRQETAPAEEVLAILEATRRQVVASGAADGWVADAGPPPAVAADAGVAGHETAAGEDWAPAPDIDQWAREEEEAAAAGAAEAWAGADWSPPHDEDEDEDEDEDVAPAATRRRRARPATAGAEAVPPGPEPAPPTVRRRRR